MDTLDIVVSTLGSFLVAFLMFLIERCWNYTVERRKKRLEESRRKLIARRNEVNVLVTFAGSERQTSRRGVGRLLAKVKAESIDAEVQFIQTKLSEGRTNYGGNCGFFKRVRLDLQVLEKDIEVTKLLGQEFFKDVSGKQLLKNLVDLSLSSSAMSDRMDVREWQYAVNSLRQSRPHDTSGTWDTHALLQILEFSYQNLKDDGGGRWRESFLT